QDKRWKEFLSMPGLCYAWQLEIVFQMGAIRSTSEGFCNNHRPVLLFSKGLWKRPPGLKGCTDTYSVSGFKKLLHPWEQPLAPWVHWLDKLTPKGCTICDPFCGSGTNLLAAKLTGRRGIGTEIDAQYVATARARLQDAP